jgi:hypothetical protein
LIFKETEIKEGLRSLFFFLIALHSKQKYRPLFLIYLCQKRTYDRIGQKHGIIDTE